MDYDHILSKRVTAIKPSGIRRFFDLLNDMTDGISLGIGEPDFVTPMHIRQAGIDSLLSGQTKYTSNSGIPALREGIGRYLEARFGLSYCPAGQMVITVGGSEAIDMALRAIVEPGDEVIVPTPSFVCYGPLTSIACGSAVELELREEDEFRLTPERLRSAITPKTKALILPYPCNPTGAIMEKRDLEAVADVLRGTDIMVISDEIYAELTYGGEHVSFASLPGMYERTILVSGFSKAFAMTGWRLGYACGPEPIIAQMTKIHQFGIMSAPTMAQYAGIEAMKNGVPDIAEMRASYDERRKLLFDGFRRMGLSCFEPRGAFYMFPSIRSTGLSSEEFCTRFLSEERVAVIPGSAFGAGGEGFVRCCYAASKENLEESLRRMERFLSRLK